MIDFAFLNTTEDAIDVTRRGDLEHVGLASGRGR